jgi:ER lumen protein retaining receptor
VEDGWLELAGIRHVRAPRGCHFHGKATFFFQTLFRSWSLSFSLLLLLLLLLFFSFYSPSNDLNSSQIPYTFSLILESLCILPQLLLLRQTSVPTVIDSFYLATLGSYRAFYILNWIVRSATEDTHSATFPISVIFGILQTLFYFDFAWVYWTRQRVKLRYGGVVDGEDISRGWLISKVIGQRGGTTEHDDDDAALAGQEEGIIRPGGRANGSWGPRGISVSADDGVLDAEQTHLTDPAAFEDDYEDDAAVFVSPAASDVDRSSIKSRDDTAARQSGVSDGVEWRDDHS